MKRKNKKKIRTTSETLMDDLEPITNMVDEGGPVWHPTEHDESDDLEDAKVIEEEYRGR